MIIVIRYKKRKNSKFKEYILIYNSLILSTLPDILIIQLKRFKVIGEQCKKLFYYVSLPFDLNLNFLLYNKYEYSNNNSTIYKLKSMIIHVGSGLQQGHYYSIVKNELDNKWYKLDDEYVVVSGEKFIYYIYCYYYNIIYFNRK